MPGLVPGIPIRRHGIAVLSGMAGTSPAMTRERGENALSRNSAPVEGNCCSAAMAKPLSSYFSKPIAVTARASLALAKRTYTFVEGVFRDGERRALSKPSGDQPAALA